MNYRDDKDKARERKGFAVQIALGAPKGMGKGGMGKGEPDGDEGGGADDGSDEAMESAGMDLADAIKSGDGKAIASAVRAICDM